MDRGDIKTRFKEKPDSFSRKPIGVLLPKNVDAAVRAKNDRSAWLRKVIATAIEEEPARTSAIATLQQAGFESVSDLLACLAEGKAVVRRLD